MILLAASSGFLMRVGDLYQPFRLRTLTVRNVTPQVEQQLRDWSEPFLPAAPLWWTRRGALEEMTRQWPLTLKTDYNFFKGALTFEALSLPAKIELFWKGQKILMASDGTVWPESLSLQTLVDYPKELPQLQLDDTFPLALLSGESPLTAMNRSIPGADWYLSLLKKLSSVEGLVAQQVTLRRRGGQDVIVCRLTHSTSGNQSEFIGVLDQLDHSLLVARELLARGKTTTQVIDATYSDKVILRSGGLGLSK